MSPARLVTLLLIGLTWAAPLVLSLVAALAPLRDIAAWQALLAHPQVWPALRLSLQSGAQATLLALLVAVLVVMALHDTALWRRLSAATGPMLAVPHLSFALGLALLVAPTGLMARLAAGSGPPPGWVAPHDPAGLWLSAALAAKEAPFLVALLLAELRRGDFATALAGQIGVARSLGHGGGSVWLRVVLPQLLPRLAWPLLVVWSYGASVVDMALVLGPTAPPTLAQAVWADLNDAEASINLRGAAGALLLAGAVLAAAFFVRALSILAEPRFRRFASAGPSRLGLPRRAGRALLAGLLALFAVVLLLLAYVSVVPLWPWPRLLPDAVSLAAWRDIPVSALFTSLGLAFGAALLSLTLAVLWFETLPPAADRILLGAAALLLALPPLLIATGQYRVLLAAALTGTGTGLFAVHLAPSLAYVVIMLAGPMRSFDRRYATVARSLGAAPLRLWWQVKRPLLAAPLALAAAIGFAVSFGQFAAAQLAAAGRFSTLPMEAITLSSGGNRALIAATGLALALPPLMAFLLASLLARSRWA